VKSRCGGAVFGLGGQRGRIRHVLL
jgi:hypothetical protein